MSQIRIGPPPYDFDPDTRTITATVTNNTSAPWDFYGIEVSVASTKYPDRAVVTADLHPDVNEIRPGESLKVDGTFLLQGQRPSRAWWEGKPHTFSGAPPPEDNWDPRCWQGQITDEW